MWGGNIQNGPTISLSRNTAALQRGFVLVPVGTHDNRQLAASLQVELMNLGHALDATAFDAVSKAPRDWIVSFSEEVIPHLRKRLGADRPYQPFYRNFPTQVMEMSNVDLLINALLHYWSNGTWEPHQILRDRGFAFENVDFRVLKLGAEKDFSGAFNHLVSANQSLTDQDKEFIGWMIYTYGSQLTLPSVIPFKETLCILAGKGLDVPVQTTTDVLRIAVYLSGGDISLPAVPKVTIKESPGRDRLKAFREAMRNAQLKARESFKFKKFSRPQRRRLLGLLEKTNLDVAEMHRHLGRWQRLGEVLHPGEFAAKFPRTAEAFQRLRNQRNGARIRTFAARVDLAFKEDWRKGVELLATRPGEFARRLDWMLRTFDSSYVLDMFARVAPNVSSKVLFELYDHFNQRFKQGSPRAVVIKGKRSKMKTLPPLPPLDMDLVQKIGNTILKVIRSRIASLSPLGKVWIDQRLKHVAVPFAMRSINTSVKTYVRGTRIPFRADAKVIRPFIHWYDENGDQDLDLSVGLYNSQLQQIGHVSFTGLTDMGCCHSGDIRHRQGPCAEYVDIPLETALNHGVRYATVQVYNYNARPMHTVKECVFGLMEREHATANEIFIPKTISNCMALANEGTSVVVCIIDLLERNCIWVDIEADRMLATLENTASKTVEVLAALIQGTRMPLYDLLSLHAQSRGTLVDDEANADLALRWEDFVTDYARAASYMSF